MSLARLLALCACFLFAHAQQSCENVVTYGSDEPGRYSAQITLSSEFTLSGIWLRLEFQSKVQLVASPFETEIKTDDNLLYRFHSPDYTLKPGEVVNIPLSVKYSEFDVTPRISFVRLNGRVLCPAPMEPPRISPCPSVVLYTRSDADRWHGTLSVKTDVELQGVWVRVELDTPGDLIGSKFGEVRAKDNQGFLIFKREHILKPGQTLDIPFFVKYAALSPIPNVKNVKLNGRTICGSLMEEATSPSRTIPLRPIAESITNEPVIEVGQPIDTVQQPTMAVVPLPRPNTIPSILPKFRCGVRELNDKIFFGAPTTIEQYPWHGAIFHSTQYACGMSLISPYHAVSAAHCFYNNFLQVVDKSSINLYFGLSNIQRMRSSNVQIAKVQQLFLHPQYRFHIPRYDVAVVKFDRPIEFTEYVQPICLWQEDASLSNVVNKSGVVVGFGLSEAGTRSNHLLWAKILVVDSETCRDLNPSFYATFLSKNSYCAGNLDMATVCRGDSGGGMYFQKTGTEIWQLRGITSTSKPGNSSCDNSHYAIFTDVASYKPWIEDQMRK